MNTILPLINLWDNPVFQRFRRSQLRTKKSIFWYLVTLIVTTFVITLPYIIQTTQGASAQQAARNLWIPLLVIQGLILLFKGTGATASGLIQDKINETLDYQRLTPMSPLRNVVGYLFGLPVLEYVMFALTLPHLAFIVIKGNIPLGTVVSVYLVFFTCAMFYHMTAIGIGLVLKRWILGYLVSMFSVLFLNAILPGIASQFGLKFLQFLSIVPVIGQKVIPIIGGPAMSSDEAAFFAFDTPVPFFNWSFSPFYFTLLLQGSLIVTFATMAIRRWQKEDKHSLSKPYALGVLTAFIVLVTGNLWPIITRQELPFQIFGMTNFNNPELAQILTISLPMVYSFTILLLCSFLFTNVVPSHAAYTRGVRRARKHDRKAALPWEDDSANIPFMSLFVVIALIGYWAIYGQMMDAGFMSFLEGTDFAHWRFPLVLGLVLFATLMMLQTLQHRGSALTVLLLWLVPILVAIVSAAAMQDFTSFQTIVASLSPLAAILMSGLLPGAWVEQFGPAADEVAALVIGARTGIFFLVLQIVVFSLRWRQLLSKLQ